MIVERPQCEHPYFTHLSEEAKTALSQVFAELRIRYSSSDFHRQWRLSQRLTNVASEVRWRQHYGGD